MSENPPEIRRIGVVGAGQLARMMLGPAIELGLETTLLATAPQESAAAVAARVRIGRHDDEEAVRALAGEVDAITFDHEHVPAPILESVTSESQAAVRP